MCSLILALNIDLIHFILPCVFVPKEIDRDPFGGEAEFEMNRGGGGGVGIGGSRPGTLVETRPLSMSNRSIDR